MLNKYLALFRKKQNIPEHSPENHGTLTCENNHDDTHNMNRYKYNFEEYVSEVTSAVARFGFLPKGKNTLVRQTEHCTQRINFVCTKVRNKNEIHVITCVAFTFPPLDKLISDLSGTKYDKGFPTGSIPLETLSTGAWNPILYISDDTDVSTDVQKTIQHLEEHALAFWDSCDTLEKFYNKLKDNDPHVVSSVAGLNKQPWNLLGLTLLLQYDAMAILEANRPFFEKSLSAPQFEELTEKCKRIAGES